MKNLIDFAQFSLNECLMPTSDAYGMYDFSNENHEILNDELTKLGVEFEYDPYHNKTVIKTDKPEELVNFLKEKQFQMIKIDYFDEAGNRVEDDCVQIALNSAAHQKNIEDSKPFTQRGGPFSVWSSI